MDLLRTIRNVVANLRDGNEPAAVRTDQSTPPSQEYLERVRAVELTKNYIASLESVPRALREELCKCIAHVQQPLLSVEALAERVASYRQSLSFAINRIGQEPTAEQAQQLMRLAELQRVLERLSPAGPVGS